MNKHRYIDGFFRGHCLGSHEIVNWIRPKRQRLLLILWVPIANWFHIQRVMQSHSTFLSHVFSSVLFASYWIFECLFFSVCFVSLLFYTNTHAHISSSHRCRCHDHIAVIYSVSFSIALLLDTNTFHNTVMVLVVFWWNWCHLIKLTIQFIGNHWFKCNLFIHTNLDMNDWLTDSIGWSAGWSHKNLSNHLRKQISDTVIK